MLSDLIEAGIDCIEHGTGLQTDQVEAMAERGVALVPTVMQLDKFPQYAAAGRSKFPAYTSTMTDLYVRRRDDGHVGVQRRGRALCRLGRRWHQSPRQPGREIIAMVALGLPADYALGAASWRAREWLGWNAGLDEGAPADFVVYDADPLEDLSVLLRPACVVLRGRVVA